MNIKIIYMAVNNELVRSVENLTIDLNTIKKMQA